MYHFQINIIVFILVIRQMMGTRHVQSKSRDEKLRMGVKATAVILPLLGITWLFGLLAFNSSTVAFKYIFAICNSLQGLMIFIFHCLLNQQVKCQRMPCKNGDRNFFSLSVGTSGNSCRSLQRCVSKQFLYLIMNKLILISSLLMLSLDCMQCIFVQSTFYVNAHSYKQFNPANRFVWTLSSCQCMH